LNILKNITLDIKQHHVIGQPIVRSDILRLLEGKGQYVDDIHLPRLCHLVFVRSPYAHAKILKININEAKQSPGVIRIAQGEEIAAICKPYTGILTHLEGMKSASQLPLAMDRALWHGHPVVAVVAETRAQAEDAAELVEIDWEPLQAIVDEENALDPQTPIMHPELGSNLCWERKIDTGDVDATFEKADLIIEEKLRTGRHTHVTLEPRSILVNYSNSNKELQVWHSTQVPHMMHWILSHHFEIPENNIRVIAPDVGGSFGLKIHIYGDEMATVAMSILLGRPVKFVADRLESFLSDCHARDHHIYARMAVSKAGKILAIELDDIQSLGPYATFPRGGVNEARQVINLVGASYGVTSYRARTRAVFQNKSMYGQYRSVGRPIACLITESLVERAAVQLGIDPLEFRLKNYIPNFSYPYKLVSGPTIEILSQHESIEKLKKLMNYDVLRIERDNARSQGILRGIGFASFLETSSPSSSMYGKGGASIAASDTATLRLLPTGSIFCSASINEFGQGAETIAAQITATILDIPMSKVRVVLGDTDSSPYGGGNYGSRGTSIGGEAILQTAKSLKTNIIQFASVLSGIPADKLDLISEYVVEVSSSKNLFSLQDLARTAYFNHENIPKEFTPELTVSRSFSQRDFDGIFTNGIQASYIELDPETGYVKLLKHWVVEDVGRVLNPLLLDEQIRGGAVQGIGAALYEQCLYSDEGQMINGSLVDYLVPLASEMPDIEVGHTCTLTKTSELGAKGGGEGGVAGSSAAVLNAINDALSPLNVIINEIPATPQRILKAILVKSKDSQKS
jgi:carbon-monoxide dehydrogenase large subunit